MRSDRDMLKPDYVSSTGFMGIFDIKTPKKPQVIVTETRNMDSSDNAQQKAKFEQETDEKYQVSESMKRYRAEKEGCFVDNKKNNESAFLQFTKTEIAACLLIGLCSAGIFLPFAVLIIVAQKKGHIKGNGSNNTFGANRNNGRGSVWGVGAGTEYGVGDISGTHPASMFND